MAEFNKIKYIFSTTSAIIEVGEEARKLREKQISFLIKELFLYKILIKDLVSHFPTYRDRNLILNIANYIYQDNEIFERIEKRRELPIAIIARKTQVSRTFLEIWQDYILTYVLILSNPNYKYIQDYIRIELRGSNTAVSTQINKEFDFKKGIVLKAAKGSVIVLTSSGEFLKLKKNSEVKIGEEFRGKEKKGIRHYKLNIAIGAVLLMCLMAGAYYQYSKPVRTIILDTTSQLKLELNKYNSVIYAYSPTQKGKEMIEYVSPLDKNIDKVLQQCLEYASENEMIPNKSLLITVSGDALKYGILQDTAKYVKENNMNVLINNSGKQHKLTEMLKDQKEDNNEEKK